MSYWKILSMGWFILHPCSTWHRISLCESCTAASVWVWAYLSDMCSPDSRTSTNRHPAYPQAVYFIGSSYSDCQKNCHSESNPQCSNPVTCGSNNIGCFRGRCESLKITYSATSLFHICFLPALLPSLRWSMRFCISLELLLVVVTGYYFFLRIFNTTFFFFF